MQMAESEAKKKWDRENSIVIPVKLMRRTENDVIDYLNSALEHGVGRSTILKTALREYMINHPIE